MPQDLIPFADPADARAFQRRLLLHLAQLRQRSHEPGLHEFVLLHAVDLHRPSSGADPDCLQCDDEGYPCATVLLVALMTRLSWPWTPAVLGRALTATGLWPARAGEDLCDDEVIEWGDPQMVDPRWRAERRAEGWLLEGRERGAVIATHALPDDAAMVDHLVDQVRWYPYPLAWAVDEEEADAAREAAWPARQWWREHVRLPYLRAYADEHGGFANRSS